MEEKRHDLWLTLTTVVLSAMLGVILICLPRVSCLFCWWCQNKVRASQNGRGWSLLLSSLADACGIFDERFCLCHLFQSWMCPCFLGAVVWGLSVDSDGAGCTGLRSTFSVIAWLWSFGCPLKLWTTVNARIQFLWCYSIASWYLITRSLSRSGLFWLIGIFPLCGHVFNGKICK